MKNNSAIFIKVSYAGKKWLPAKFIFIIFLVVAFVLGISSENPASAQAKRVALSIPPDSSLIFMNYRNNWANYISISTNANMHPEAEGIKNSSLTVHNETDKLLSDVKVKIDYLTANGKTYKSETVTLSNIGPNSGKTIAVPESDKGVYAKMEIINIEAPSFHFCYSIEKKATANADPYFCK
ncbi:MAG TPA: hypothetical protein VFT78_02970 [Hanamia sp.]|nr:hypothetical protein [Hanamia sp.]